MIELTINMEVCSECMDCVECCPTGALYYQDGFHFDSSKCAFDEVCADVCPEQCIEVTNK